MKRQTHPCPNKCDSEGRLHGGVCAACGGKGYVTDVSVRIDGQPRGSIDEKRVKLPGLVVSAQCPTCKHVVKKDLGRDGFDYPVMNKPFDLDLCCNECECEWGVKVVLTVQLGFQDDPVANDMAQTSPRARYRKMLDLAMDLTPEGESFVGRFVDMIVKEGR